MGTFDSILEQFGDSAGDLFGSDAGDLLDNVKHTFADNGDGSDDSSDGDGGSSWTDTLGGLFGGGSDDGEDGESGGGWGALSGLVDRLSGDGEDDGDSDSLFSSVIDKATSFLPDDLRAEAESLFRGGDGGSSWAGSLLDRATDARAPQPDDFDDLVTGRPATMNGNAAADGRAPDDTLVSIDDPTFPDDPDASRRREPRGHGIRR